MRKAKRRLAVITGCLICAAVVIFLVPLIRKKLAAKKIADMADHEIVSVPEDLVLEEDAHTEINELLRAYFTAFSNGDIDTVAVLKQPIQRYELLQIQKEAPYIEKYDNFKVFTVPGLEEGSTVAWVYYEIKFKDINRLAPGLSTLYIHKNIRGELCIYGGVMDEKTENYIRGVCGLDQVRALLSSVNTRYKEAITEDSALKYFMEAFSDEIEQQVDAELSDDSLLPDNNDNMVSEEKQEEGDI